MSLGITIKDHIRESQLFTNRSIVFVVICLLAVTAIIVRLTYLQVIDHVHYTTLSQNNRLHLLPLKPIRGLIYDRNGVVLAQNIPSYILSVTPERVKDLDDTLAQLGKLVALSEDDIKRFHKSRRRNRPFKSIPLRFRLTDEEIARVAVNRHRFPGVDIDADLTRHYPLGKVAVHTVGYVGRIDEKELETLDQANYDGSTHIGKTGLEKYYEDLLHGQVGHQEVETNAQGRVLRVINSKPPIPGENLHLHLDAKLQRVAQEAFDGENGALIAIDPNTGGVLSMVSIPAFDPNLFVNGIDTATYKALTTSPDQPLYNRALHGQYPPGSTTKPFLGLASLELHYPNKGNHVLCPGWYMLEGDERRYRDWKRSGHGIVNLEKAIAQSCDVFFYDLAFNMGIDRMAPYLKNFGFGQLTGIDLSGELDGLMPSREWKRQRKNMPWFPGESLITGIGQGYMLATPLQMASITATMANKGLRLKPRLVAGIQDPITREIRDIETSSSGKVEIKFEDHWKRIVRAMTRVVHSNYGTAKGINKGLTYKIAGKTGTSQVFGIKQNERYRESEIAKKLRDHALFVGFAPVKSPDIALAIIVENGGSGGAVAAPLARIVMDAYLLKDQETVRGEGN